MTALPGSVPVLIMAPCNYVSNVAYYRVMTQICEHDSWNMPDSSVGALVQGFAALSFGSAFWHGSHTYLGNVADNRFIDVISFIAHQASVEYLPCDKESGQCAILHDLNTTSRAFTAVNSTQRLTEMFRTTPVDSWIQGIDTSLDIPQYYITFSAIICNLFTLLMPEPVVNDAVAVLSSAFNLSAEDTIFINSTYLPALRNATTHIKLNVFQKIGLGLKGTGTVLKLGYAFLWQEWVFPNPLFLKPFTNRLGAYLMPAVNTLTNFLTGFKHAEQSIQKCENVYPGDELCRVQQPHSKWHEESANGLLDLMFLCDDMRSLMKPKSSFLSTWVGSTVDGWFESVKAHA